MKTFSIVIPVYQNETNIEQTVSECLQLISKITELSVEIVFVDDGSTDRSLALLKEAQKKHPKIIKLIKFTKNSGQPAATLAGMIHAKGDAIGVISADSQDPFDLFIPMLKDWQSGKKLIIASRIKRSDGVVGDFMSQLFYRLIRKFVVSNYPMGGFDFFIVDRVIVEHLEKIREKNGHIVMLIFSLGYSFTVHPYERKPRLSGKSQYTFWRKIKVFYDAFIANTYAPIRFVTATGAISAVASLSFGGYVALSWFYKGQQTTGWASIVVLVSFFSGLILLSLGILGEYLWRIYEEVRNRPRYIIDEVIDAPKIEKSETKNQYAVRN